jgi:hypothetical protein
LELIWKVGLIENRIHRTLGNTEGAVNAALWVDHDEIRTLVKTVYWAHIHTVGKLALNTLFSNNKGHGLCLHF